MRIASIGGGPAGLFFSILMKRAYPDTEIVIHERNRADDTFGWGVVFSDETLGNLEEAEPETMRRVREAFRYWGEIDTFIDDLPVVRSVGHGFCGMSRRELLLLMHERCRELGIELNFESEVSVEQFADYDLILGVDGVNSAVREQFKETFKPTVDWRRCRFAWFGTDKPMEAFTFVFQRTEWGLFQVHAYPFEDGRGTWIVECDTEVWQKAGLDKMNEEESARFCERIFARHLEGHKLLINRSVWRQFPTIRCEKWYHDNIVLMGDAVHTAHFSIGSGTKLAMEDAMALLDAFVANGTENVPAALAAYQEARWVDSIKLQKAAQTSLEWFENSARYIDQDPLTFQFNLMTRSKRITYDNLAMRDPALVADVTEAFARNAHCKPDSDGCEPPPMFSPFKVGELELPNRVAVSPMCQYSAADGLVGDWHLVHLGSRAVGGAGLVITEMTDVSPEGRITPGCAGLWNDAHEAAWKRIVDFVHANSPAKICVQLAHAGRKGSVSHPWKGDDKPLTEGAWQTIGPSAIPFQSDWPAPKEMDRADMDRVRDAFVAATERADRAGFDMIELHAAHGYLLSSFLSPLSNHRGDEYGGSLENRLRYPLEVLRAVREVWPKDKPISVRISASDWAGDEGLTGADAVEISRALGANGADLIDVSSGGNVADKIPEYGRMYQVPFADRIRHETGLPVMAVGAILGADHCNTILAAGRADLCAMARPHLGDPYLTVRAAGHYGYHDQFFPGQYEHGRPRAD